VVGAKDSQPFEIKFSRRELRLSEELRRASRHLHSLESRRRRVSRLEPSPCRRPTLTVMLRGWCESNGIPGRAL
jgi:hypothetical protein